jgi:hypothetical protein
MISVCVGGIGPRNDFICELKCENGPDAFRDLYPNGVRMNNSGLYDPPFRYDKAPRSPQLLSNDHLTQWQFMHCLLHYDAHAAHVCPVATLTSV